jgi:hypothetical protein
MRNTEGVASIPQSAISMIALTKLICRQRQRLIDSDKGRDFWATGLSANCFQSNQHKQPDAAKLMMGLIPSLVLTVKKTILRAKPMHLRTIEAFLPLVRFCKRNKTNRAIKKLLVGIISPKIINFAFKTTQRVTSYLWEMLVRRLETIEDSLGLVWTKYLEKLTISIMTKFCHSRFATLIAHERTKIKGSRADFLAFSPHMLFPPYQLSRELILFK